MRFVVETVDTALHWLGPDSPMGPVASGLIVGCLAGILMNLFLGPT